MRGAGDQRKVHQHNVTQLGHGTSITPEAHALREKPAEQGPGCVRPLALHAGIQHWPPGRSLGRKAGSRLPNSPADLRAEWGRTGIRREGCADRPAVRLFQIIASLRRWNSPGLPSTSRAQ
jgi:hypothetical protein